jgi:hypothetical protein
MVHTQKNLHTGIDSGSQGSTIRKLDQKAGCENQSRKKGVASPMCESMVTSVKVKQTKVSYLTGTWYNFSTIFGAVG